MARDYETAFEAAEKVPATERLGPVCWPGTDYPQGDMNGDGWFSSVGALIDACARAGRELPAFVWAATPDALGISADDVIENALVDHHEEAEDRLLPGAHAALQSLLDTWVKAYGRNVKTWREDTSRAVVFGDAERERLRSAREAYDLDAARVTEDVDFQTREEG